MIPRTQEDAALELEEAIRDLEEERAYLVSPSGKVKLLGVGNDTGFSGFVKATADDFRVGVFVHNHPQGGSFSPNDVSQFLKLPMRQMRVVSRTRGYRLGVDERIQDELVKLERHLEIEDYDPRSDVLNVWLWSRYVEALLWAESKATPASRTTQIGVNRWTELVLERWVDTARGLVVYEAI